MNVCLVGWFGMAKDTVSHERAATVPTMTTAATPCYYEALCPKMTSPFYDQLDVRAHEGIYLSSSSFSLVHGEQIPLELLSRN